MNRKKEQTMKRYWQIQHWKQQHHKRKIQKGKTKWKNGKQRRNRTYWMGTGIGMMLVPVFVFLCMGTLFLSGAVSGTAGEETAATLLSKEYEV